MNGKKDQAMKTVVDQEKWEIIMRKTRCCRRKRTGEMKDRYSGQRQKHESLRFQR